MTAYRPVVPGERSHDVSKASGSIRLPEGGIRSARVWLPRTFEFGYVVNLIDSV